MITHLRAVFKQLAKSKFHLKCKKYTLFFLEVKFFGHIVSERRVLVLLRKVLDFVTLWHILAYNFQTVHILINICYIIWKVQGKSIKLSYIAS